MKKFLCPYSKINNDYYMRLDIYGRPSVWEGKYIAGIWRSVIVNRAFGNNGPNESYRIFTLKPRSEMLEFESLSLAQEALDKQLIEIGYTLLTEEEANKYRVLL